MSNNAVTWTARWIGRGPFEPVRADRPMPFLRRAFTIDRPVTRAIAHVCGLGHFELRVNGAKAGDDRFEPGWTDYRKTCLYVSHDVTALLRSGDNAVGVLLGHGMHHVGGGKRYRKFTGSFGPPRLLLQLELTFADGSTQTIASDDAWRTQDGPITHSCIYGGEDHDARLWPTGWDAAGFDESGWDHAIEAPAPAGELVPSIAPPVRAMRRHAPIRASKPDDRTTLYDLGQNFAGVPRVVVRGPAGLTVTVFVSELLDGAGRLNRKHMGSPVYFRYTLAGTGGPESWEPRFSYTGFRYVEVECDGGATINGVTGVELHADVAPVGTFACSEPLFERTVTLIDNALRSNFQSILTDCPHREKLGWLEQLHLVGPGLCASYDVASFLRKACRDMRDAQHDSGFVPTIAPQYTSFKAPWDIFNDSPEWGSSMVLVPWQAYTQYGDATILHENYDAMRRYVDYLQSRAGTDGIVEYGLGDWYDIGPGDPGFSKLTGKGLTATAIWYADAVALANTSRALGRDADSQAYDALATKIRADFNRKLFDPARGVYDTGSQCAQAMPLALGMVEPEHVATVLAALIADIESRQFHTTAGDVGFRFVIDALALHGRSDVIFKMLSRTDPPSYGAILASGATTLTEAWDANPKSSQNHVMLGHALGWFHEHLAGIRVDLSKSGDDRLTIAPAVTCGATWARSTRRTPLVDVSSSWRRNGDTVTLDLSLPERANVIAGGSARSLPAGEHALTIAVR